MINLFTKNILPSSNIKIESNFVYNFFDIEEETASDNFISTNSFNNQVARYIKIGLANKHEYKLNKLQSFLNDDTIREISSFHKKTIDKEFIDKYIYNVDVFSNFTDFIIDFKEEDISRSLQSENLNPDNFGLYTDFLSKNKKVSVNKKIFNNFFQSNKYNELFNKKYNSDFFTKKDKITLKKIEKSKKSQFSNIIIENIFPSFTKNNSKNRDNFLNYYCNIGYILKKYIKDEDEYKEKSCMFLFNTSLNENNITEISSQDVVLLENFEVFDRNIKYGKTYLYAAFPIYLVSLPMKNDYHNTNFYYFSGTPTLTKDTVCKEFVRPSAPASIRFKMREENLQIMWEKPDNLQGDIVGYQIFKRKSIKEPYTLIRQVEFNINNSSFVRNKNIVDIEVEKFNYHKTDFIDYDFSLNQNSIYSICSIDARGYTSNYSGQFCVKYNARENKCEIDQISYSGAPLNYPNIMIPRKTKFIDNDDNLVLNTNFESDIKKVTLYLTPEVVEVTNQSINTQILKENYKFNIFSLEDNINFISNIQIKNI